MGTVHVGSMKQTRIMVLKVFPRGSLTVRQWSALLIVACIVPATIATTLLIYFSYKRERANVESVTIEVARALMQVIDRELSSARGALEALGTSPYLASGDLAAFYKQAAEVQKHLPGSNIAVSDSSGRQLINTLVPYGTQLPMHGNPQQIRRVFQSGQPLVSDLYVGTVSHRFLTSVDVPVLRDGQVKYVLSMQFFPGRLDNILVRQHIPEGWVVALVDGAGVVVARTRQPDRFIGQYATPGLRHAISQSSEGSIEDHTLEGIPSVAIFSRSSVSSWTLTIGVYRSVLTGALWKAIAWTIAGALLLFLLALALAKVISERIVNSICSLVEPAMALGYGNSVVIPPLHLKEARDVGQALLQAEHLLQQRTAERDQAERAEQALREAKRQVEQSEAFLRGIFEETPDAVFLVGVDGRIVRANAKAEHLFGDSQERLGTRVIDDLLFDPHSENRQTLREALFSMPARRTISDATPLQARRGDGEVFPVDVMASPLRTNQDNLVIVTVRDVTDRMHSEEALRESEKRFRSTLEHAPIGIAIVSLDGHWQEVNNAVCEIVGYDKEELLRLTFQDVTYPDDLQADLAYSQQLLRGEIRSYQMEKRYVRKDGSIVPVLLTGTVLRDDSGNPLHFIAQIQDISERKRAEEEMIVLNRRLALATRAGGIAVWDWDLVTGILLWDERMFELYRVPQEQASQKYDMWRQRLHPDDLARAERERDEALAGQREYATEFRIVWPDGQIRFIRANAILSRDRAGKPLRLTGTNIDITESRKKEEAINAALREKETLLKELYHRVKNNLQVITSLFNLQLRALPQGPARTALSDSAGRVRAMALVHEKLYQSGNLSSIMLDAYVSDLCAQLGRAASVERRGIDLRIDVAPIEVGLETAVPLGLLLNELISNSLKHAFPEERGGCVVVHVERTEDNRVRLSVSDDGVGFPVGSDPTFSASLGLKLVAALSNQLGGELTLENRNGAYASLVFRIDHRTEIAAQVRTGG